MHTPLHNKSPRLSSHKIIPLSLSFVEAMELPWARAYPERLYRKDTARPPMTQNSGPNLCCDWPEGSGPDHERPASPIFALSPPS